MASVTVENEEAIATDFSTICVRNKVLSKLANPNFIRCLPVLANLEAPIIGNSFILEPSMHKDLALKDHARR